jgi:hypothetical protein
MLGPLLGLLGYEIQHHVGASARGQFGHHGDLVSIGNHRVVGAKLLGQLERVGVLVYYDDPGSNESGQALNAYMTEPARTDNDAGRARIQKRDRLAHRVVGGDASVRKRRNVLWPGA